MCRSRMWSYGATILPPSTLMFRCANGVCVWTVNLICPFFFSPSPFFHPLLNYCFIITIISLYFFHPHLFLFNLSPSPLCLLLSLSYDSTFSSFIFLSMLLLLMPMVPPHRLPRLSRMTLTFTESSSKCVAWIGKEGGSQTGFYHLLIK